MKNKIVKTIWWFRNYLYTKFQCNKDLFIIVVIVILINKESQYKSKC